MNLVAGNTTRYSRSYGTNPAYLLDCLIWPLIDNIGIDCSTQANIQSYTSFNQNKTFTDFITLRK